MKPYVIEATVLVTSRVLIFAEDDERADVLIDERKGELAAAIVDRTGIPLNDGAVLFDIDVRPAMGHECVGPDALTPGAITFEECDDPEHEHPPYGGPSARSEG